MRDLALPTSARCADCSAPLTWERTVNGERIPVDALPSPEGNLELRRGRAYPVQAGELALEPRYTNHLETCSERKKAGAA